MKREVAPRDTDNRQKRELTTEGTEVTEKKRMMKKLVYLVLV